MNVRSLLAMGAFALSLITANAASAAPFTYTFSGTSDAFGTFTFSGFGDGTFTGTSDPFTVDSLTGSLTNSFGTTDITGLSSFSNPFGSVPDQTISFSQPQVVSAAGLSFSTVNFGDFNFRFSGSSVDVYASLQSGIVGTVTAGSVVQSPVTAVPGPLAGAGIVPLLGFGVMAMRRRKKLAA